MLCPSLPLSGNEGVDAGERVRGEEFCRSEGEALGGKTLNADDGDLYFYSVCGRSLVPRPALIIQPLLRARRLDLLGPSRERWYA